MMMMMMDLLLTRTSHSYLQELFRKADKNGDETHSLAEIVTILETLNVQVHIDHVRHQFKVNTVCREYVRRFCYS